MKLTPEENETINTYNKNASEWASKHSTRRFWGEEMDKFHSLLHNGKILEIGSGGGRDAKELIEFGYDYTGVDVSEELLKEAKKKCPDGKFFQQSIYELDFPENYFDGFWASATLLHIPKGRIDEAFRSIKKFVKPEGIGVISIKRGEGEKTEEEGMGPRLFSYYQKDEFKEVLQRNSFEIIEFKEKPVSERTTWLTYFVRVEK